jgi:predicted transposase YbfD/YdcC
MDTLKKTPLMDCLAEIEDPRRTGWAHRHDLQEMLVIAVCAVIADAENFADMALWAERNVGWLRQFMVLKNGTPSHDTLNRLFRLLDAAQFEGVFRRWVAGMAPALGGHLAVDGKTMRGSGDGKESPIHMVSAFRSDLGLVLGQEKVAGKSNEITAIPELLNALFIRGCLVSIDAMGCQKEIAATILEKDADYLLAVKGNQPTLLQTVSSCFDPEQCDRLRAAGHYFDEGEQSHGRLVAQRCWVAPSEGLVDPAVWPGCKLLALVESVRFIGGKLSDPERRYYISSRMMSAQTLADCVRGHWAVENRLHWMLDVTFGEDASMVRKDDAAQNFSLLRKIALTALNADLDPKARKLSARQKRKAAAWNVDAVALRLGLQRK